MSRGLIRPGDYWEAKKEFYIGRNHVRKGTIIKIHGVTAYEDKALVQFVCKSYMEMQETTFFRKHFKVVK